MGQAPAPAIEPRDPRAVLLVTGPASRVLYASRSISLRSGYDVPEVVGRRLGDLWGGRMGEPFYRRMWRQIAMRGLPFVARVENVRKGGVAQTDRLHLVPLLGEDGRPAYFLEMQPAETSAEGERRFQADLFEAFGTGGTPAMQAACLNDWVFGEDRLSLATTRGGLIRLIEDYCIRPVERAFSRRASDRVLVEEAQRDPARFDALYRAYRHAVVSYLRRRLSGDDEAVEDLAQDVFIRAYRALPGFRPGNASYLTYLLRISHNLLVNRYRMSMREAEPLDENAAPSAPAASLFDLEHGLSRLSATERLVLLRFYRDGSPVRDIATDLGRSENAVKLLLSRARKRLRTFV